jgi:prepilin-type N-terminal cleavage/methylation domain-containing protein
MFDIRKSAGFTLLEIMLVVIIIAVIVTIVTPRFHKTVTTVNLANTTQDIAQLMRYLRCQSVTENTMFQLKFDLTNKKYYAQKSSGGSSSTYNEVKKIPEGVNIALTLNPVNFYTDGSVDKVKIYLFKGNQEYFKDMGKMINKEFSVGQIQDLSDTEYIYTITTQPSIGRVEVETPKQE